MKNRLYLILLFFSTVVLVQCSSSPKAPEVSEFAESTQVESGKPANAVLSAYKTTMLADGKDETLIRIYVSDEQNRKIMSADNVMRIYVTGNAAVDRGVEGTAIEYIGVDENGAARWDTQLVNGGGAFMLRAGTKPDKVKVEVSSAGLEKAGHEIHTISPDQTFLVPTEKQIRALSGKPKELGKMIGADISFTPQIEAWGRSFSDGGEEKDVVQILADNGFNYIRLRIFVNPENPKGYSPGKGFCGLDYTKQMARRVKDAGMNFLLDFHYSDYWADPQQQNKPLAWKDLSYDELKVAVEEYTLEVINELTEQGTPPDMVQVGNEINHGLLWPDGHIGNLDGLAGLLKAGVAGVRKADPEIPIMMHVALGGQNEETRFWYDNMVARGVEFDLIGLSYYPQWHATLDDLKHNMLDIIDRYGLPVNVVEYSVFKSEIHDVVFNMPKNMGQGAAIWEPLRQFFDQQTGEPTDQLKMYNTLNSRYLSGE